VTYRLGIEVGDTATTWAVVPHPAPPGSTAVGAAVDSVVAVSFDGRLLAGGEVAPANAMRAIATGFADRLGDVTPVMLAGIPYGIEALVGHVMASILRAVHRQQGEWPHLLALAHTDELDEYRRGLLAEAARLAGVPLASVALVARSRAVAAFGASGVVAPAAIGIAVGATLADRDMTAPPPAGSTLGGVATAGAVGGALGGVGAATIGAAAAGDAASLAAPAAYAGTPLATGTAFGGTPLAGTGGAYGGTPLAAPGGAYGGTPLSAPGTGYGGTPLSSPGTGYGGTPVSAPGAETAATPDPLDATHARSGGRPGDAKRLRGLRRLGPKRLPLIAGGSAAAALVVAASAIALRDDTEPEGVAGAVPTVPVLVPTTPVGAVVVVTEPRATTAPTAPPTTTPPTDPPTTVPTLSQCALGTWQVRPDTFAASIAAEGDGIEIASITGGATVDVTSDGHFVLTYQQLTITAQTPEGGPQVSLTFDGTVDSVATFSDDGTITILSSTADGTFTTTVVSDGATRSNTTPLGDEFSGSSTYTCDTALLGIESVTGSGPILFDRTAGA
jgi:hypothetical protein